MNNKLRLRNSSPLKGSTFLNNMIQTEKVVWEYIFMCIYIYVLIKSNVKKNVNLEVSQKGTLERGKKGSDAIML